MTSTTKPPAPPPAAIEDDEEDTFVIKAKDGKSRVTVPESWMKAPKRDHIAGAQIQGFDPAREQYIMVITHSKQDFTGFQAFADLFRDQNEYVDNFKLKGTERTKIGGLPSVRFHYSGAFDGVKFVYWEAVVHGKKAYYQVVGWTLRSREKEAAKPIRKVIDSFRETKRAT